MDVFDAPIRPQIVAASRQIPKLVATPGSKKKAARRACAEGSFVAAWVVIEQGSFLCFRHVSTPSFAFLLQVTPTIDRAGLGLIGLRLNRFCEQEVR
jgi:hypothetical protein